LAEFDAEDKIVVAFIKVDDAKAVEHRVARFFLDHGVHNLMPAIEAVSVGCGVQDGSMVKKPHVRFGVFQLLAFLGIDGAVRVEKDMLVAEVPARRGSTGIDVPVKVAFLHLVDGNRRRKLGVNSFALLKNELGVLVGSEVGEVIRAIEDGVSCWEVSSPTNSFRDMVGCQGSVFGLAEMFHVAVN
jgi:hypothetical protein